MANNKVLVAGASGLVGRAAVERFVAEPGWDVVGVSRRDPRIEGAEFVSLDLDDPEACERALGQLTGVTHLVYAALFEKPGLFAGWIEEDHIQRNGAMLRNLFEPLSNANPDLRHVSLLHGTKAYGVHHPDIGPRGVRNPLREREPRIEHPNFYFVQEDYLREKQRSAGFGLSTFRPTVIYGTAEGNNLNPIPAIGAYAAILRERGEPLHYPGQRGWDLVREAVDARLVASALLWAANQPAAADGAFNLTNGDVFTWAGVWPAIAESMDMKPGEQRPFSLAGELPQANDEWAAIVGKYGLAAPRTLTDFVGENSLIYADMLLGYTERGPATGNPPQPVLNSTIAGRKAGFHDCIDTEDMFRELFAVMRREKKLP